MPAPTYTAVWIGAVDASLSTVLNWYASDGTTPLGRLPNKTPNADVCDLQNGGINSTPTSGTLNADTVDSSTSNELAGGTINARVVGGQDGGFSGIYDCIITTTGTGNTIAIPVSGFIAASASPCSLSSSNYDFSGGGGIAIHGDTSTNRVTLGGAGAATQFTGSGAGNQLLNVATLGPFVTISGPVQVPATVTHDAHGNDFTGNVVIDNGQNANGASGAGNAFTVGGTFEDNDLGGNGYGWLIVSGKSYINDGGVGLANQGNNGWGDLPVFTGNYEFNSSPSPYRITDTYTKGFKIVDTSVTPNIIIYSAAAIAAGYGPAGGGGENGTALIIL